MQRARWAFIPPTSFNDICVPAQVVWSAASFVILTTWHEGSALSPIRELSEQQYSTIFLLKSGWRSSTIGEDVVDTLAFGFGFSDTAGNLCIALAAGAASTW